MNQNANTLQVQTSCGFAVPIMALRPDPNDPSKQEAYFQDRDTLGHWAGKQIAAGKLREYQASNNNSSLDGLPGLRAARKDHGERMWYRDTQVKLRKANGPWQMVLVALLSTLITAITMNVMR
jgi:hypothetical protein